LIEINNRWRG